MDEIRSAVTAMFARRGGVAYLAKLIDAPITTVHKWKSTGRVPHWRWPQIEAAIRTSEDFQDQNAGRRGEV
jgi:hypothetical protein